MIRFIKRTKYVYALCAKPVIYARLIKSFWRTAEVVTDEAGVSVVRGNITRDLELIVSEEAIRTALRIDDDEADANDELTTAECQACFVNMGHPPIFPKSQFVRAQLGKKWKLLCYVIQQCMSRRSAGFDNFPSDIASPIVAIAENKPFNVSKWIMKGFVFNLVKGKRFKFLMYPRFLQLMINIAYPIIREEGFAGGILYTEDMNDLSYRKMSIGNDLVDEVPDNLLDDDEYFARHPEEEDGNENEYESEDDESDGGDSESEDDSNDDSGNDGNDDIIEEEDAESVPEEAENVEIVTDKPVEVEKAVEEIVADAPKDVNVQYSRSRRSKSVIEPVLVEKPDVIEDVNVPEIVDIVQIAKEVAAEVETVAHTVDDTEDCLIVTDPVDIATSSRAAEHIYEPKECSPKVASYVDLNEEENKVFHLERMVAKLLDANEQMKASNERKKKRLKEFWTTHQKNLETFKALDEDYEKLKAEHEQLKADYEELQAECNTLRAEKEVLENWIKEEEAVSSKSDKDFMVEEDVGVSETPRDVAVYQTRSQRSKTVTEPSEEFVPIPNEAADTVNSDKAEGKRKLDAVPEITGEEVCAKKARIEETVQIEPIQSESVTETEESEVVKMAEVVKESETEKAVQIEPIQSESVLVAKVPEVVEVVENVPETVTEEAFQFEPVQTETAPMIEALDDLDDIDFTESEPEAEPEVNPDDEIPADLPERFAYLEKIKYNPVYLNGLTVSQINEEYEKCLTAQDKATADEKEFVVEMGEWHHSKKA
ncbi:hypothetical protein QVD17_12301 [Tagetes erecta]|uniref:Uncharacterized protein n=1 Tax=Tagetes erecta TaxID=13708 RepID=A0AAD8L0Y8_TARER|nr:hypothetical protein QVD17_12301 [Tagetes erecta]